MEQAFVYVDAVLATLSGGAGYGLVPAGALAISDGLIVYAGSADAMPDRYTHWPCRSLAGRLVTPGLVDCHTHLVYAGSRAREFELRLEGASYAEIANAGGGIFSTVEATRRATEDQLVAAALPRLDRLLAEGVTTIEIKSGYGLDEETEMRMLRAARRLGQERKVRVCATFLGAHAIPPALTADDYLEQVCLPTLKIAAGQGLVDAVDGYCEQIAFSPAQIERVFRAAGALGLPVKLHAEQLSNMGGAALAATFQAQSADHLEYLDDAGIAAMSVNGTVPVLLPGAFYFLRERRLPPIQALRDAGLSIAVATDSNPGSSPLTSLLLAMNMGATLFGLSPVECLRGVTVNAHRALGLDDAGTLSAGQRADLAIWDVSDPAELTYRIGDAPLYQRVFGGQEC